MKKSLATLTVALMLASTGTAFAASTVELTVKGLITPTACTPSLSAGGVIDHGKISAKDLNPTTWTQLPNATLQMSVNCDAKTLFAIQGTDNRAASSTSPNDYGLGLINNTQKIGSFSLEFQRPIADGAAIYPILSMNGGLTWVNNEDAGTAPQQLLGFRDSSTGQLGPIPIQDVITDLLVRTQIVRADGLDLSNEVTLDGSATLEVKYL